MALVTVADLRSYLRIQTTDHDDLLTALRASAVAACEAWLGRPITAVERTYTINTFQRYTTHYYAASIFLPEYPVQSLTAITDSDDETVDLLTVRMDARAGVLTFLGGTRWLNPPYTITAVVGLSAYAEYASQIEPVLNMAIRYEVADYWHRRNPGAQSEREGGGIAVQYSDQVRGVGADVAREDLLLPRVANLLAPWRMVQV